MPPLEIYQLNDHYIALEPAVPIPAVGEGWYGKSPGEALANVVLECRENGIDPAVIEIQANQHAGAGQIRAAGLTPIIAD